ncbi:hypothetical protein ABPG72_017194 [Tetrahymena utriculariae]
MDKEMFGLHQQQRFFLEEYSSNLGIELKEMNHRRGQSLNSEIDLSKVHNSSVQKDNTFSSNNIGKLLPEYYKSNSNNIRNDNEQLMQNNLENTNVLVTVNERVFTAQSCQNIKTENINNQDEKKCVQIQKKASSQHSQIQLQKGKKNEDFKKQQTSKSRKQTNLISITNQKFQNMNLISKVMKKISYFYQMYTQKGRLKFLENSKVREIINDNSESKQVSSSLFFKIFDIVNKLLNYYEELSSKYIPLIDAYGNLNLFLLTLYLLYNFTFFYFLSLVIFFEMPSDFFEYIYFLTGTLWVIQSFLQINTKIYKPFEPEYKRKQIFLNYMQNRSFFDLIPIVIVFYLHFSQTTRLFLKCLLFLKLKNIITNVYEIQKQLCMMSKNYFFIKLINLILQLFLIAHILSICWYLLAIFEVNYLNEPKSWYDDGISSDLVWWKLYLSSIYWCLTLMTTGSNIASTVAQTMFTCISMIFTAIVYGYLINIIGIILSELDKEDETKNRDINIVNEYMRAKNISRTLKTKVNMDIEYYYTNNNSDETVDKIEILNKLPQELVDQLQMEYGQQIISKISFISENFSKQLQDDLGYAFQEESFFPNQTIYSEKDTTNLSVFYILQGEVTLQKKIADDPNTLKTYKNLKKGQIFGELSFITDQARESTAITSKYTKVVKILRSDFLRILQSDTKDYEVFKQLKDNILLYEQYKEINLICSICGSCYHQEINCNLVHISKFNMYFQSMFNERQVQSRQQQIRNKSKFSSILKSHLIREGVNHFQETCQENSVNSEHSNQDEDYEEEKQNQILIKQQSTRQSQDFTSMKKQMLMENSQRRPSQLSKAMQSPQSSQLVNNQDSSPQNSNLSIGEKVNHNNVIKQASIFEKQHSDRMHSEQERKNSNQSIQYSVQHTQIEQPPIIQNKGISPWLFEQIKEYDYYFPKGNSKYFFIKANKFVRKQLAKLNKQKKNK